MSADRRPPYGFDNDESRDGRPAARGSAKVPEPDSTPAAGTGSGRAKVPQPKHRSEEDREANANSSDPLGLIPRPDETTLLPRIPSRRESSETPQVPQSRRKRAIRRHRDDTPVGGKKTRVLVRGFAEIMATVGGIVLLFTAYVMWGTSAEVDHDQDKKDQQLADSWAGKSKDPTLDPVPGNAIARLYIPQIREEPWIIVEGTTLEDIETAPGHYKDNAMPGDRGNFAVAGHNVPAIFRYIDALEPGNEIVVETKTKFFIYEITDHDIVKPNNLDVVGPVPNDPGASPGDDDHWITLTTCYPWWDNYERYIVWGKLSDTRKHGDKLPPEAEG